MPQTARFLPLVLASALALALPAIVLPTQSLAQAVGVSITVAPPPLPVYAQPIIPAAGYFWVPGYWAWGPAGYYWVPGTWVLPPAVGLLWTPGYWAWVDGGYFWHAGYWGPTVGFYGGIDYGFGYFGVGYLGGHWDHDHFFYNRAVNNFGHVHITNVYNAPVHNLAVTHVSFNGGHGGTSARPSTAEQAAFAQRHADPTAVQMQHEHAAAGNHSSLASVNHGRPAVAATPRAASFTGAGIVHSRGGGVPQHQAPAVHRAAQPGGAPRPAHVNGGAHPAPHGATPHAAPAAHEAPPHPQGGGHDDHGGGHGDDHPHP
ncbi:MAG TPA: YXWGXW repeat-containing protein [Stellaceae bacterium]